MADPVLLGLGTAACWGVADFAARFLGRSIGALPALTLVTLFGAVELAALMAVRAQPLPPLGAASPLVWAAAAATVAAMWAFYEALCRAPLVVVAPLVGAYPAWGLLLGVALLGLRPDAADWAAMAAVILGMALVARGGDRAEAGQPEAAWLALGSGLVFAVAVLLAQQAGAEHGSAATVYYTRILGGGMLLAVLLVRARCIPPPRWVAAAAAQAGADTGGYLLLYAAAAGLEAAIATVVSSAFGAVSVLLARVFLKERIRPLQAGGMVLVFGGVAWLAA